MGTPTPDTHPKRMGDAALYLDFFGQPRLNAFFSILLVLSAQSLGLTLLRFS